MTGVADICRSLVERNAIDDFPSMYRTYKICETAIKYNPKCISRIPRHLLKMELCELAISLDIDTIKTIPWKNVVIN